MDSIHVANPEIDEGLMMYLNERQKKKVRIRASKRDRPLTVLHHQTKQLQRA